MKAIARLLGWSTLSLPLLVLGLAPQLHAQGTSVSPSSVSFGNQLVGTTSAAQLVTVKNTGTTAVTITSATAPAPFAAGANCNGKKLSANASCTFNVTFKPTAAGAAAATLTVAFATPVASQTVSLSGTGIAPTAAVSPTSLSFGSEQVMTTSPPQTVTLSNTGSASLQVTGISINGTNPGNFSQTNTCGTFPATLVINASCTITVTFKPNATGTRSANLAINVAKPATNQSVPLSGVGVAPSASLNPTTLSFGNQAVGTTSAAQVVTLSNTGIGPLSISSIGIGGMNPLQFSETDNCGPFPATIAINGSCQISVTFKPTSTGAKSALLQVHDGAGTQSASLSGTGTSTGGVPPAFTSASSTTFTVGVTGSFTVTATGTPTPTLTEAGTLPGGVMFAAATGALSGTPSTAGTFAITFTATNTAGTATQSFTLNVNKGTATVTLSNLTQTYTGSPLTPTVTTTPSGLATTLTGAPDTNAGTYAVTATVNDPNYAGSASGSFVINKAAATVTLGSLTQTYTGSALTPTVTTSPANLATTLTGAPDTNAGTYPVTATVNNPNYTGSASGSFVIGQAAATVTLSNLTQTYTGSALTPTVTTSPANVTTTLTGAPDTNAGTYPVTATVNDPNYTGSANGSFVIGQATPVFSNLTPSQSITYGTSSIALSGTLAAGSVYPPSGETVSITIAGSTASPMIGGSGALSTNFLTGSIAASSTPYTITYSYSGDANFTAATDASTTLTVAAAATLVSVTVTPANASMALGSTQQFTATGNYSDSTNHDLTVNATWTSSAPSVATISATGLATAVALGRTTVTATYGGITGATNLGVTGTGNFVPGGNMNVSRDPFTATLLNDGTVLIAGGFDGSTGAATASSEVSDPSGQTFALLNNSMTTTRAYHTATLLNNGLVLIAGGVDNTGAPTATAELYNPATKAFAATGSLSTARYLHTATLLQDGTVLFAGGIDNTYSPIATNEVYYPATGKFTVDSRLVTGRYGHTATLLSDGTVFIAGGGTTTPTSTPIPANTAEIYTGGLAFTNSLSNTMTTSRAFHTATLLNDGTILLAGGVADPGGFPSPVNSAEIYNPSSQSFAAVGNMTTSRAYQTATLLTNGMVLVAGGAVDDQGNFPLGPIGNATGAADLYNPASAAFTTTGGLATPRSQHTATLLTNGSVLIAGGAVNSIGTTTNTTELYQPASLAPAGLTSITINPANLTTVFLGHSQLFTAMGNNGQQLASVTWSSSDSTVAVISNDASNSGTARFVGAGPVTIQACAGPICGSESFTVVVATLVSLAVTPSNPIVGPVGSDEQFTATGTYTDNSTQDVTASAAWSSSNTSVATISGSGLASTVGLGGSTIQASVGNISGSTTLTVVDAGFTSGATLDIAGHTATQLNNGFVLIAGGNDTVHFQPVNPQLYDPANGSFTPTGAMNTPRSGAKATLLNNGTVLIAGGSDFSGNLVATAEVYDPGTGTFSNTGALNVPRTTHTATVLNDGTVLITGGSPGAYGSTTNIAEIYDPRSGTFTQLANTMTSVRRQHTATLLNNGTVLIVGGQDTNFSNLNSAEVYDSVAQTFTAVVGLMTDGRSYPTATLLNDGTVLVAGGASNTAQLASAEIYTPTTGTFTSTAGSMANPHYFHEATLLNNGTVLIAGGCCTTNSAELYDPVSGTFSTTGNLNTARYDFTATRLNSGDVLVVGGATNAELYHPSTLTPANLVSIVVTPNYHLITTVGGTQPFTATGTFSINNVTSAQQLSSVTWSSTDVSGTKVAQITNDATDSGVAQALSQGTATITACAGTICGSATLAVGPLNYYQVQSTSAPTTRCCVGMAFDSATNSTLLFGGVQAVNPANPVYTAMADTWQFTAGQWSRLSPANAPPAREGAGMAYDPSTGTVVLFGGTTALFGCSGVGCTGHDLNDTWIWDGTTWTEVFPVNPPPARRFDSGGMAYDAASGNVVMFGGAVQGNTVLGDTWIWDGKAQTWTQRHPANSPSARAFAGMSSDSAGNVILFGGSDYGSSFGDTWVWNGSTWQQQSPSVSPPARSGQSMALDASISKVVMFGGSYFNDTWIWDGTNWTQLSTVAKPPDRYSFGMDYDGAANAVVLFGGFSSGPARGDTWKLSVAP